MRRSIALVSAAALTVSAAIAATAAPAQAADVTWAYQGVAGATQVNVAGQVVSSGLVASSNLDGTSLPNENHSEVAAANLPNLLAAGVATSGELAAPDGDGVRIISTANVADLNLLNGAIRADAIETTAFAKANSDGFLGDVRTKLLRLSIGDATIPIDVAPNTKIEIPGLLSVVINERKVTYVDDGDVVRSVGAALHITLLKAAGDYPAGAEIWVNPVKAALKLSQPTDALPVGGFAYGLYGAVGLAPNTGVVIQPIGQITVPQSGTGGITYGTNVAGVKLPNLVNAGVVTTSMNALTVPGYADVTTGAEIAGVKLLNGLISLDAIQVSSHVRKAGAVEISEGRTKLVDAIIAGIKLPINPAPNTVINVLGVGKVYLNQQIITAHSATTIGLRVVLSTAKYGLPVGADIQVATSSAFVTVP